MTATAPTAGSDAGRGRTLLPVLAVAEIVGLTALLGVIAFVPDLAYERPKMVWSRGLLLLLAALVLARQSLSRRCELPFAAVLMACGLPVLVALVAWLGGDVLGQVLAQDEVERLATLPLAIGVAGLILARPGARRVFGLALAVAAGGVAAWALAENLSGMLGLPLDRESRPMAGFGNPVFLGAFLVLVTPFCMSQALYAPDWRRWPHALAAGLCLPAVLTTATRSAWLGLGVAILVGIVLLAPTARQRWRLLAGLAIAGLVALPFVLRELNRPQQHTLIWRDTLAMVSDHPWGVGPGQFPIAFVPYASRELLETYPRGAHIVNDAHNEPLQIVAELGWIGLLAALVPLGFLIRAFLRLLRSVRPGDPEHMTLVAGIATVAGLGAQSFTSPDLRFGVTIILLGLIIGFVAGLAPVHRLRLPQITALLLVPALACAWMGVDTIRGAIRLDALPVDATAPRPENPLTASQRAQLIASLSNRIHQDPDDWTLHYYLGMALGSESQFEESAASFRRALELQPRHLPSLRRLGEAEARLGEYGAAIAHLTEVLEQFPDDLGARYWRALSEIQTGDLGPSLADVEYILAAEPDFLPARLLLEKLRE